MKVSPTGTTSSSSPPTSSPFSATSAFRPPNTDHTKASCRSATSVPVASSAIPPIGPYPASATFVGYPTPGPTMPTPQPVAGISTTSEDKHSSTLLQLKSSKEESHHVTAHDVASNSVSPNKSPSGGLPSVTSPDSSKQYTILQPAGVGSRAASAIQDIAREGVVSVAAVSSCSTASNGSASNVNNANANGNGVGGKASGGNGANNSSGANSAGNPNANSIVSIIITTVSTTTTTSSPTVAADVPSASGQPDSVMKMPERPGAFDSGRPGMSMSPSSLGRGEDFHVLSVAFAMIEAVQLSAPTELNVAISL